MKQLLSYDKYLFRLINYKWHNNFFDWLMPWLRQSNIWVPLYLFLFVFVIINYKKDTWWWVLFAICTGIFTDFISSTIIKNNVIRIRPCNEPAIVDWVRVLVSYKPQSSSFTSSHATNHFGFAMFLYMSLKNKLKKWVLIFFCWAFSICYAQVYVGVHYPLDVICGGLIGILIGYLFGKLYNRHYSLD